MFSELICKKLLSTSFPPPSRRATNLIKVSLFCTESPPLQTQQAEKVNYLLCLQKYLWSPVLLLLMAWQLPKHPHASQLDTRYFVGTVRMVAYRWESKTIIIV